MYRFRWTIKELETVSNWKLIEALVSERQSSCSNPYSPLYKKLSELAGWVKEQKIKSGVSDWKE